jgi:7-cyano-7-deazaguanine synthase
MTTNSAGPLVLLSGGLDSLVALAVEMDWDSRPAALSVSYGQRHRLELSRARVIAAHYGVPHYVLDLTSWGALVRSSLTDAAVPVPHGHYADPAMAATIVPNRNATLLMAAAGIAQSQGRSAVVIGVHGGDLPVYPDCRPDFIDAADVAVGLATEGAVSIRAPFLGISKTEVVRLGLQLGAPLDLSYSCYEGRALACGECGACVERAEAFADAGVSA